MYGWRNDCCARRLWCIYARTGGRDDRHTNGGRTIAFSTRDHKIHGYPLLGRGPHDDSSSGGIPPRPDQYASRPEGLHRIVMSRKRPPRHPSGGGDGIGGRRKRCCRSPPRRRARPSPLSASAPIERRWSLEPRRGCCWWRVGVAQLEAARPAEAAATIDAALPACAPWDDDIGFARRRALDAVEARAHQAAVVTPAGGGGGGRAVLARPPCVTTCAQVATRGLCSWSRARRRPRVATGACLFHGLPLAEL